MKKPIKLILIAAVIIAAIPAAALSQTTPQNAACEQTAKDLEAKLIKISLAFDKVGYEQFVSEDAVIVGSDGKALNKKQEEATSFERPANLTFQSYTTKDLKLRVCSEQSIVVTGIDVLRARIYGEFRSKQSYYFTRIYEKRKDQWQLVYNQLTATY